MIASRDEMVKVSNKMKESQCELMNKYKNICTKMMHQKRQEAEKITNMSDTERERSMVAATRK